MEQVGDLGHVVAALPDQPFGLPDLQTVVVGDDPILAVGGKQLLDTAFAFAQPFGHIGHGDLAVDIFPQIIQNLLHRSGNLHAVDGIAAAHGLGHHLGVPVQTDEEGLQQIFGHLAAAEGGGIQLVQLLQQGIPLVLHPVAGKTLADEGGEHGLFLAGEAEDLAGKIIRGGAFAGEGHNADVGGHGVVAGQIVIFVGAVEGHFPAFEDEAVFIRGAEHLALVDIHHLPEIVPFAAVAEAFGQLHVKQRNDGIHPDHLLKLHPCIIISHIFAPLSNCTNIIPDRILHCKQKSAMIEAEIHKKEEFDVYCTGYFLPPR